MGGCASCVIVLKDGEILLVKENEKSDHPTGRYSLPAGFLEEGETYEDAAVREVEEETGLRICKDSLYTIGSYDILLERKGNASVPVRVCLYANVGNVQSQKLVPGSETVPSFVKAKDFLDGKYRLTGTTGHLVNHMMGFIGMLYECQVPGHS
jgi:hypothetical protein